MGGKYPGESRRSFLKQLVSPFRDLVRLVVLSLFQALPENNGKLLHTKVVIVVVDYQREPTKPSFGNGNAKGGVQTGGDQNSRNEGQNSLIWTVVFASLTPMK